MNSFKFAYLQGLYGIDLAVYPNMHTPIRQTKYTQVGVSAAACRSLSINRSWGASSAGALCPLDDKSARFLTLFWSSSKEVLEFSALKLRHDHQLVESDRVACDLGYSVRLHWNGRHKIITDSGIMQMPRFLC